MRFVFVALLLCLAAQASAQSDWYEHAQSRLAEIRAHRVRKGDFTAPQEGPVRRSRALTSILAKQQLPSATAYKDATNTFSLEQSFGAGFRFSSNFTPTVNGQIGYNGTNLLFREGNTNKTISGGSSFDGDLNGTSLGYLTDTSGELLIQGNSASNVRIKLGDNAGARSFVVSDSSNVSQLTLDSDGNLIVSTSIATSIGNITAGGEMFTNDITIGNLGFNTRIPYLDASGKLLSSGNLSFASSTLSVLNAKGTTSLRSPDIYPTNTLDTVKGMHRRVMHVNTTTATQTELSFDGSGTYYLDVAAGESVFFHGFAFARSTDEDTNSWEIRGQVTNSAGTLAYVNNPPTVSGQFFSTGAATWLFQIVIDDTNDRVAFKVTGAAATTIDWVLTIDYVVIAN